MSFLCKPKQESCPLVFHQLLNAWAHADCQVSLELTQVPDAVKIPTSPLI